MEQVESTKRKRSRRVSPKPAPVGRVRAREAGSPGSQDDRVGPLALAEEDVLDWDAHVVPPPPRASGRVTVRLRFAGRTKPIAFDDPSGD
jgi:hypothetical protein